MKLLFTRLKQTKFTVIGSFFQVGHPVSQALNKSVKLLIQYVCTPVVLVMALFSIVKWHTRHGTARVRYSQNGDGLIRICHHFF